MSSVPGVAERAFLYCNGRGKEANRGRGMGNIKEWKCLGIAALARWGSTAKGGMGRKI
jgi:hypothetical protein